jgi:dolichyl-phosphate-mannose-protein mannosyltransferase
VVIVCPECGKRNRVPDSAEPGKVYRCFSCRTRLIHAGEGQPVRAEADAASRPSAGEVRERSAMAEAVPFISSLFKPVMWVARRERVLLAIIALTLLGLQFFVVPFRDTLVYDEAYYVPEARLIATDQGMQDFDHPALAKLLIALGIVVFGDNEWGWRVPSILFSIGMVLLFYYSCREIAGRSAASAALLLFSLETLFFNFSGLAMLVVFEATFMLLAFLLYLRGRYVLAGLALALSGLCRLTGLLGGLVIIAHWLFVRRSSQSLPSVGFFGLAAVVGFFVLMPVFDFAATGEWISPAERLSVMFGFYGSITFEGLPAEYAAAQANPVEWLIDPIGYVWPGSLCLAQISPTVWILIVPSMAYMVYEYNNRRTETALFAIAWFAATYLLWIPVVILMDRVTYLYYFFPTVGAVCMAIGYAAKRVWETSSRQRRAAYRRLTKVAVIGYCILHVVFFVTLTPLLPALSWYLSG